MYDRHLAPTPVYNLNEAHVCVVAERLPPAGKGSTVGMLEMNMTDRKWDHFEGSAMLGVDSKGKHEFVGLRELSCPLKLFASVTRKRSEGNAKAVALCDPVQLLFFLLLIDTDMLKPRFALSLSHCRTYATRRPEKPPARFPDPLRSNPNAVVTSLEGNKLTFIHRPPPSAPSPLSTTLDPASPLLRPAALGGPLPPLLRPSAYRPEQERLSKEDIEKLRTLRRSNPDVYSCVKLAKMFNCTPSFVSQVAALPRSLRRAFARKQEAKVEAVRAGWGERKSTIRAIKEKRRQFW